MAQREREEEGGKRVKGRERKRKRGEKGKGGVQEVKCPSPAGGVSKDGQSSVTYPSWDNGDSIWAIVASPLK